MRSHLLFTALFILITAVLPLSGLPVPMGQVEIGLESSDGYQEGLAYISTDEEGTSLEVLIGYKGFGLDTVTWTFSAADMASFREASANAAWWRSRLLEMNVNQTVIRDAAVTSPKLVYSYRNTEFPFDSSENVLRFVREGHDYALLLTESSQGADTRRSGDKTLPVFTLHFSGRTLPDLRDMISEEVMIQALADYASEKSSIDAILNAGPDSSE
ncbi:MAG: hypothetical protein DRP60_02140 [Spirochaetes bacterium]|nr:MAG: hypothetical protein DRP60_02140 [Spirochaetota bacterium]